MTGSRAYLGGLVIWGLPVDTGGVFVRLLDAAGPETSS